jgi:hypothetical protein
VSDGDGSGQEILLVEFLTCGDEASQLLLLSEQQYSSEDLEIFYSSEDSSVSGTSI